MQSYPGGDIQDRNDSFFLLNNLLSLNSDLENDSLVLERREQVGREVFNMDWLDNLELKNEQGDGDERSPEKEEERKRKHNQVEKARRLFIDAKIRELGSLLPARNETFHELAKDMKYNKGGILAATVSYLKLLKMDQMRSWNMEQKLRAQNAKNRALVNKLQEYEGEMRSYGIPVDDWELQDLSQLKEMGNGQGWETTEEDAPRSAEQLDMDYDIDSTTGADPMISSAILDASPASSRSSRGSSIDSAEEEKLSLLPRRSKTCHSERRRPSCHRPQETISSQRIPVVSRPYRSLARTEPLVFPLPPGLSSLPQATTAQPPQITRVQLHSPLSRKRRAGSLEEEVNERESVLVIRKAPALGAEALARKVILKGRH